MKRSNKGFTLVEMLVVIAIIAVLAAILIPVVSNSVSTAKEAADIANIRSAYAKYEIAALKGDTTFDVTKEQKIEDFLDTFLPGSTLNYDDKAEFKAATDSVEAKIIYQCTATDGDDGKAKYTWTLSEPEE